MDSMSKNNNTMEITSSPKNNTPPISIKRNEYGLLEHVHYYFREDGTVDWYKMLPLEHIVPNSKKTVETNVEDLPEDLCLVLLPGLKYLASLRGYNSVKYEVLHSTDRKVCLQCTIEWIPNFETENRHVTFSSTADAHSDNTSGFSQHFLTTIAENRAFVRCVRNFLGINTVAKDELGGKHQFEVESKSNPLLDSVIKSMTELNISFEKMRSASIKFGKLEAEAWTDLSSIKNQDLIWIKGKLAHIREERKKKLEEKIQTS